MTSLASVRLLPKLDARVSQGTLTLAVFSATLFLSAFLLFSVQPIFAKMVLPKLGGSPAVWGVSMCFFQAMLLLGYLYAHVLTRVIPSRLAPLVHVTVMALAFLTLPFGVSTSAEPPAGDAYGWLIGVLLQGVGLPFFAVSANAPLLQAWFTRSTTDGSRDPYFLYGASNLGSLLALLSYPLVVEPALGLKLQSWLWTEGFVGLGLLIMACSVAARSSLRSAASHSAAGVTESSGQARAAPRAIDARTRAIWIGLSFVPSALLVAATNFVSSDVASAPLLWVVPLALFLTTFILVFREQKTRVEHVLSAAQPALTVAILVLISFQGLSTLGLTLILVLLGLFSISIVCHRALYERRPEPQALTEFYLIMSLGGVLGGLFSAIIAPQIFPAIYEFPLLLALGLLCRPNAAQWPDFKPSDFGGAKLSILGIGAGIVGVAGLLTVPFWLGLGPRNEGALIGPALAISLLAIVSFAAPARQFWLVAGLVAAILTLPSAFNMGESSRSFFGVNRVVALDGGKVHVLQHGTTLHGLQRVADERGLPISPPVPQSYYHPAGAISRAVRLSRQVRLHDQGAFHAGIVGLGAGSMACAKNPGESWRYFEIDQAVVHIAQNPRHFTFLSTCDPHADIVVGDARLTLNHEQPASYDYLLIDAFSSDAVPVHLLTQEAVELYVSKLKPDGVLAMHVSNRHLDLISVVSAAAARIPGIHASIVEERVAAGTLGASSSDVVVLTRSRAAADAVSQWRDARPAVATTIQPWTDDTSNIAGAIWRKFWAPGPNTLPAVAAVSKS